MSAFYSAVNISPESSILTSSFGRKAPAMIRCPALARLRVTRVLTANWGDAPAWDPASLAAGLGGETSAAVIEVLSIGGAVRLSARWGVRRGGSDRKSAA